MSSRSNAWSAQRSKSYHLQDYEWDCPVALVLHRSDVASMSHHAVHYIHIDGRHKTFKQTWQHGYHRHAWYKRFTGDTRATRIVFKQSVTPACMLLLVRDAGLCLLQSTDQRNFLTSSSTFCPSSSGFKSTINCFLERFYAIGEIWLKMFNASLYQRYIRSSCRAFDKRHMNGNLVLLTNPIRDDQSAALMYQLAGKSNNTKSLAN